MSSGHLLLRQAVDQIRIPRRFRTDLGDVDALAASIQDLGLLEPIVINPAGELVLGERRLAAVKQLGWREVPVWVASGISDRLRLLTAIQHDHRHSKRLDPVEEAELYAELKVLYAEYARARQLASRFGADTDHPVGAGDSPAPRYARTLAAQSVTGRDSHQAHERVLAVMALAEDDRIPERLRAEAAEALQAMRLSGTVTGPYADVITAQARDRLKLAADDPATAGQARAALKELEDAPTAVARIERAHRTLAALDAPGGWADVDPAFRTQSAQRRLRSGLEHAERWWEPIDPSHLEELPADLAAELVAYHGSLTGFLTTLDLVALGETSRT